MTSLFVIPADNDSTEPAEKKTPFFSEGSKEAFWGSDNGSKGTNINEKLLLNITIVG